MIAPMPQAGLGAAKVSIDRLLSLDMMQALNPHPKVRVSD